MKICSWDVGIINLSYCIIECNNDILQNISQKNIKNYEIKHWGIINLMENNEMKKNRNLLFENIPKKLHELDFLLDVDYVVIENQPSLKNPQMKSIQMILYSYFLMYGKVLNINIKQKIKDIDFCNASNKLKIYNGPVINLSSLKKQTNKKEKNIKLITNYIIEKTKEENNNIENNAIENNNIENNNIENNDIKNNDDNLLLIKDQKVSKSQKLSYSDKKKMAVEHVKYFLEKDEKNLSFFLTHKKKDDLADSFLQGLYYININLLKK